MPHAVCGWSYTDVSGGRLVRKATQNNVRMTNEKLAQGANLANGLTLMATGTWGYLSSENPSKTALIPVGIGGVLLGLQPLLERRPALIAAVGLSVAVGGALIKPLRGALARQDNAAVGRVATMMATSLAAAGLLASRWLR